MKSSRLDWAVKCLIVLLTAGFCYLLFQGFQEPLVEAGDKAPDFSVKTDDGRRVSRADFGGKLLVLNFWATWCVPCLEEIPSLDKFQKKYAQAGVVVLAVSVDRNERVYRNFLKKVNVSFLTARDPEADVSSAYGTFRYPETYIIDRSGKVLSKIISNRNWIDEETDRMIRQWL